MPYFCRWARSYFSHGGGRSWSLMARERKEETLSISSWARAVSRGSGQRHTGPTLSQREKHEERNYRQDVLGSITCLGSAGWEGRSVPLRPVPAPNRISCTKAKEGPMLTPQCLPGPLGCREAAIQRSSQGLWKDRKAAKGVG